jgi:hypothetical protein
VFRAIFLSSQPPPRRRQVESVYRDERASCHGHGADRAPLLANLHALTPEAVLRALEAGSMRLRPTVRLDAGQRVAGVPPG